MKEKIFKIAVVYIEYVFLPAVFLIFAVLATYVFLRDLQNFGMDFISVVQLIKHFLLIPFYLLTVYFLLLSRKGVQVDPDGLLEVFVPLLCTFWCLLYSLVELVPVGINHLCIPISWYRFLAPAGVAATLFGYLFATVGILTLRESFGIVVKVNKIKTAGIYHLVRHPLYFGYAVISVGFMLLAPKVFNIAVYGVSILLQAWRARMEEHKLAAFSVEYQSYMKRVPFFWPKFSNIYGERS